MAGPQRKSVNKKKIMPVKTTRVANIDYKDIATLKRFISERGKIRARRVTGCPSRTSARSRSPSRTRVRWPCCPTPRPPADRRKNR